MYPEGPKAKRRQLIATLTVLLVVVLVVVGVKAFVPKKVAGTVATPASAVSENTANTAPASASTHTYADGSYTAEGDYQSPAGVQFITVSLTIKGNTVSDATVKEGATGGDSQEYQDMFVQGYRQFVVGKQVDSIRLSRVSGSSLTPKGFNAALEHIKTQAEKQ